MLTGKFFAYCPEKILWYGLVILGAISGCLMTFMVVFQADEVVGLTEIKRMKGINKQPALLDISLSCKPLEKWTCPIPDIRQEIAFSLDPPRPEGLNQFVQVSVQLKQQAGPRRFIVPCRIDLAYRNGALAFSNEPSSFWLQLTQGQGGLQATVFVDEQEGPPFSVALQESPVQTAQEFQEGSPFRILAEARWWGQDLLARAALSGKIRHRIDVGSLVETTLIEPQENQWLVFEEGHWQIVDDLSKASSPYIARIKGIHSGRLELEGWEADFHVRLSLPLAAPSSFKGKAEDLFGSIRVRSDKQISCILDKQCLILKVNDWALKVGNRWKILRKAEEKEAVFKGKLTGEIFVLDQIFNKQGQKSILGHFYNSARTDEMVIDLPVSGRKSISSRLQSIAEAKSPSKGKSS